MEERKVEELQRHFACLRAEDASTAPGGEEKSGGGEPKLPMRGAALVALPATSYSDETDVDAALTGDILWCARASPRAASTSRRHS